MLSGAGGGGWDGGRRTCRGRIRIRGDFGRRRLRLPGRRELFDPLFSCLGPGDRSVMNLLEKKFGAMSHRLTMTGDESLQLCEICWAIVLP